MYTQRAGACALQSKKKSCDRANTHFFNRQMPPPLSSSRLAAAAGHAWAAATCRTAWATSHAPRARGMSSRPAPPTGGTTADPITVDLLGSPASSSSARVDAYDGTGFEVGGVRVEGSLLVAPGGLVAAWAPQRLAEVDADALAAVRLLGPTPPTLLILGVGARPARAPPAALAALAGGVTGIEALPTPQAAALYNVLSQEGRSVCAALLPAGEVEE